MIDREQEKPTAQVNALLKETEQTESLPYSVELWDDSADQMERLLARATNALLARAIFKEAQVEYPGRRLTISNGSMIIADSDQL